ncbi:FAD binding domain-containing protein [Aaosphaeria arxii CBS 175.79]|uniref:FAD binding domain-containing protein n=1 Tax=Aaosphaeria arxii CBS 175.79 TaxID=1450172 RepID=A0A6A5XMU2_9PLEO|nr:FAD binding domain-containing protein [Aaosphaeria arxii CBS 175.79]KAF2014167.1 FAD binding domain-containing protein [Aaosphaeria arxii CBS 175.79]
MSRQSHARVLIAGGSVAGLTLANALERIGIDFLVLEKYDNIAPNLGASIGVFPNGMRILDQLGCYEAIQATVSGVDAFGYMDIRNPDGTLKSHIANASQHFVQRLGYSPILLERQMLIQVLYDNLKDKSRVLPSKGVVNIVQDMNGVRVTTRDGTIFTGEMLVGADGIHSIVRREMWRMADAERPGYFPIKERNVPVEYCCIFGISKPMTKFIQSATVTCDGHNYSYVIGTGPGSRICWFLFKKLEHTSYGLYEKIPRFTDAERDALAREHANDPITEDLRFGEIYDQRISATLQALPEMVFSKWHYGRMITIGDAVHKFNPIGGQGGNSAIEDVAILVNHLHVLRQAGKPLTTTSLTKIFSSVQSERMDRAQFRNQISHLMQSVQARDSLSSQMIAKYLIDGEATLNMISALSQPGARLKMLDAPNRAHYEPYSEDCPAIPLEEGITKLVRIFTTACFAACIYLAHKILSHFTGIAAFENVFQIILLPFAGSVGWTDPGHTVQALNLFLFLVPIFLIWYIEGNRSSARGGLQSWPFIYGVAMSILGIGIIAPLYFLISLWSTSNGFFITTVGRHVPRTIAMSILPSILLGFVLPTLLMFIPSLPTSLHQGIQLEWQFTAILVSILIQMLSTRYGRLVTTESSDEKAVTQSVAEYYRSKAADLPHLFTAYRAIFAFATFCHVVFIAVGLFSTNPRLWLLRMLIPSLDLPDQAQDSCFVGAFISLKWNFIFAVIATLLHGLYTIFDLRSRGLITTESACKAIATLGGAQIIVGPGAALVGLWGWREKKIAFPHAQ